MNKYYTGIGSRQTPEDIQILMTKIAKKLCSLGYVLRSGGAEGADVAFEKGAGSKKEIYLPWKNFNNNKSTLYDVSEEIIKESLEFHPTCSEYLSEAVKLIMGRNLQQVLGQDAKTPSSFVICWTHFKLNDVQLKHAGGTGQALRIASRYNIPIFNLNTDSTIKKLTDWLNEEI